MLRCVRLRTGDDGRWAVTVDDTSDGPRRTVTAKFVFIGAGGGSLPLPPASKIPDGRGHGGFPVSDGQRRRAS
jgi:malate dehydrogenase (quinone)